MTPYLVKKMAGAHASELATTGTSKLVAWHGVEIATSYANSERLHEGRQLFLAALGIKKGGNAIDYIAAALLKNNKGMHYAEAWKQAAAEVMDALTEAMSSTKAGRDALQKLEPLQSTCTLRMKQRVQAALAAA